MKKVIAGSILGMLSLAGVASAEVVRDSYQFKGEAAQASFFSTNDCGYAGGQIWGAETVTHRAGEKPAQATQASAHVYSYNFCTGEAFDGFGYVEGAGATINNLSSASLSVPVTLSRWVCDELTCTQEILGTATFTASLVGDGDTYQGHSSSHWSGPGVRTADRQNGRYRQSTVTGSLVVNGVEIFTGEAFGEIINANSGSHTVQRF